MSNDPIEPVHRAETPAACENCGASTGPRFCGVCGQEVRPHRGPLVSVVREILADWLSLDSRLTRTLTTIVRPGALTVRYLGGERQPFLRPFRLYLIASLLLFSSVLSIETLDATNVNVYVAGELVHTAADGSTKNQFSLFEKQTWPTRLVYGSGYGERLEEIKQIPAQALIDGVFAGTGRVMPIALICFVPFLALALTVLFWRTRTLYVDHLIFALHLQSALFLALATVWLLSRAMGLAVQFSILAYVGCGFLMLTMYLALALRRVYRHRWRFVVLETAAVLFAYGVLANLTIGTAMLWVTMSL